MGSNKLAHALLMTLVATSLTACKQGGNGGGGKTQFKNKNGGGAVNKNANTSQKSGSVDANGNPVPPSPGQGGASAEQSAAHRFKIPTCSEIETAAKQSGWISHTLEVPLNHREEGAAKLKIRYYTLKEKDLSNPVLVLQNGAMRTIQPDVFSTFKSKTDLDPIVMEVRGTGCSGSLPDFKTKSAELQNYGARNVALDAELVRKAVLKDEKWKVLARQQAGLIAIRMMELNPSTLTDVSVADYAYMKDQKELSRIRGEAERKIWAQFLSEMKLSNSDLDKARANLEKEKGANDQKIRGAALLDVFARTVGVRKHWEGISKHILSIAQGAQNSGANLYNNYVKNFMDNTMLNTNTAISLIDGGSISAINCVALTDEKTVNTCRLENKIGAGDAAQALSAALKFDEVDLAKVKSNIEEHQIKAQFWYGGNSIMYPKGSYNEQDDTFNGNENFLIKDNVGAEVVQDPDFLGSLKK